MHRIPPVQSALQQWKQTHIIFSRPRFFFFFSPSMLFFCKSAYRTVAILLADSAEIRKEAYQGTKEKESLQFSTDPGPVHGVRKHKSGPRSGQNRGWCHQLDVL